MLDRQGHSQVIVKVGQIVLGTTSDIGISLDTVLGTTTNTMEYVKTVLLTHGERRQINRDPMRKSDGRATSNGDMI